MPLRPILPCTATPHSQRPAAKLRRQTASLADSRFWTPASTLIRVCYVNYVIFYVNRAPASTPEAVFNRSTISEQSVETGFVTGNNRKVLVGKDKLDITAELFNREGGTHTAECTQGSTGQACEDRLSTEADNEAASKVVSTGFVTGANRKISVDKARLARGEELLKLNGIAAGEAGMADAESDGDRRQRELPHGSGAVSKSRPEEAGTQHNRPARSGHHTTCGNSAADGASSDMETVMADAFRGVSAYFKGQEGGWVFSQFRWAWLHLYLNPLQAGSSLPINCIEWQGSLVLAFGRAAAVRENPRANVPH